MTQQVTLEEFGQLKRIPADWLDDDGRKVLEFIPHVIERIKTGSRKGAHQKHTS